MSKMIILSLLLSVLSSSVHSMDDVMEPAFSQKDERPLNISLNSIINAHLETLPKISQPSSDKTSDKANTIAHFLAAHRDCSKINLQQKHGIVNDDLNGLDALSHHIESLIDADKEIVLFGPMLAFKSRNPEKVLLNEMKEIANRADLGELLTLMTLKNIATEISKVHTKGARIDVCSDGRIFTHTLNLNPKVADEFAESVSCVLKAIPHGGNVRFLTELSKEVVLDDELHPSNDPKIETLMPFFAREIGRDIKDPLVRQVAQKAHQDGSTFSKHLKKLFDPQGAIRMSIHTDLEELNLGVKVAIHMMPLSATTAPHGCPVLVKNGEKIATLIKRRNENLSIDQHVRKLLEGKTLPVDLTPAQLPLVVDTSLGVEIPFLLLDADMLAKEQKAPLNEVVRPLTEEQLKKKEMSIKVNTLIEEEVKLRNLEEKAHSQLLKLIKKKNRDFSKKNENESTLKEAIKKVVQEAVDLLSKKEEK